MERRKTEYSFQSNESDSSEMQQKSVYRTLFKNELGAKHLKSNKDNSLQLFKRNYMKSKQFNIKSGFFLFFMYKDVKN